MKGRRWDERKEMRWEEMKGRRWDERRWDERKKMRWDEMRWKEGNETRWATLEGSRTSGANRLKQKIKETKIMKFKDTTELNSQKKKVVESEDIIQWHNFVTR